MRLQEFMSTQVVTIGPGESADAAWTKMQDGRIRHLVVMDGAQMVGLLSERDLGGRNGATTRSGHTVRELMTENPASATSSMTLRQAANLMRGRTIGSLPVVDDGRVVGIVTATDVLDELGRGATRPEVRAQRQSMRVPPASARRASAVRQGKRQVRQARTTAPSNASDDAAKPPPGRNTPTAGRSRVRTPDSESRAPMAAVAARAATTAPARRSVADIPAYIRAPGQEVDGEDRAYLRRKLGRRLGKFAGDVERTSVRLEDINGPRGGVDWQCRIKATLRGQPSVVVQSRDASMQGAMDRALAQVGTAVRRALQQRRTVLRKSGGGDNRLPGTE